jgi:hypothetical protein
MGQGSSKDPEETGRLSCVCHSIHDKLVQERKRGVELLEKEVVAFVAVKKRDASTGSQLTLHRGSSTTLPGLS